MIVSIKIRSYEILFIYFLSSCPEITPIRITNEHFVIILAMLNGVIDVCH